MKEEILRLLRSADGYISGQELCNRFGVSRTAVWKAINQLKEAGYEIEAQQNKATGSCSAGFDDRGGDKKPNAHRMGGKGSVVF